MRSGKERRMCNEYRNRKSVRRLIDQCNALNMPLRYPGGIPNTEPSDSIRITDRAPILRNGQDGVWLEMMRWSWPGAKGAPVFNFRSEKRRFDKAQRCLIPADGFYEFTPAKDAKAKRKEKWLFTSTHSELFAIAGMWRANAANGEDAWTMLTCDPGPDIAPYHDRQVVVLEPERWTAWLSGADEKELLLPSDAGSIAVEHVA
jgi:putative SOS response-associated peptidase YedK